MRVEKLYPTFEPIDKHIKWFYFKNTPELLKFLGEIYKNKRKSVKQKDEALNKLESKFKDFRDETDEEKVWSLVRLFLEEQQEDKKS